jgi:hypothetical protein
MSSSKKIEVTRSEFARMAGVSRVSVEEKVKHKPLNVNAAGLLDTENPLNAAYLSKHRRKREMAAVISGLQVPGARGLTTEINACSKRLCY